MQDLSSGRAAPRLHCDESSSVLTAIEEQWRHHGTRTSAVADFYAHLAGILSANGLIIDACDGLEILEHCRKHDLPIVDVLHDLEKRVRTAGYTGGSLTVADFQIAGQPVYVFYDSKRFENFAEVRTLAAERAPACFQAQAAG